MRATDAGWLLTAIARGGVVELPSEQSDLLDALAASGLIRSAPDAGPERARMALLRNELDRIAAERTAGRATPELVGRERGLRSAVVELSERLAQTEGAAEVRRLAAHGPYRGHGLEGLRWQVTQRGRTLLSDLGPRLGRIGGAPLASFEAEMKGLRDAFTWRAQRAAEIAAKLAHGAALGTARRSVPIGLSAVRAPVERAARAFDVSYAALRSVQGRYTVEQDAAFAECLCLVVPDLSHCERPETALYYARLRHDLLAQYTPNDTEDALDAATLLSSIPVAEHAARIALAGELATALRSRGKSITLSLALIALSGETHVPAHLALALAQLDESLAREVGNPSERLTTSVLLAFLRGDLRAHVEKWRTLRQYLSRFASDGMAVAAALLSWVALEPAETLDDLRLASAALAKHSLAHGAAESMTHAIKLLVSMAALAAGSEGDHEERLALAPVASPHLPQLGLSGALGALPLAAAAVTAFHRTVLDAAAEWERIYQPTHQSYVYGGGRRHGWG